MRFTRLGDGRGRTRGRWRDGEIERWGDGARVVHAFRSREMVGVFLDEARWTKNQRSWRTIRGLLVVVSLERVGKSVWSARYHDS